MSSTSTVYTRLTALDVGLAYAFAQDQIEHTMCTDPEVVRTFCKDKGNCIRWRPQPERQLWNKPRAYSDVVCKTDADCSEVSAQTPYCTLAENGVKLCAYDPVVNRDIFNTGTCEIVSQSKCEEFSKSPYVCNETKTDCPLSEDLDMRYYEWHTTDLMKCDPEKSPCPGGANSRCLPSGECTCKTDADCLGTAYCQPSDKTPGEKVCKGGGRCVFGNHVLREWCENPKSRCVPTPAPDAKECKVDGDCPSGKSCFRKKCVGPADYPTECKGSGSAPGMTNVPPFYYHKHTGKCFMTAPYCERHVLDFGLADGRKCTTDNDCTPVSWSADEWKNFFSKDSICASGRCTGAPRKCTDQNQCADDEVCHAGYCTGPRSQCGNTKGGEFAGMNLIEMTLGKTAYASIIKNPEWKNLFTSGADFFGTSEKGRDNWSKWKDGFDCNKKEAFTFLDNTILPLLKDIPPTLERIVDERYILTREPLSGTYVDKVKLYLIIWLEDTARPPSIGFTYIDLKKVYPSFLKKIKGVWHLKMKWNQLRKTDIALKRIYIMSCFGERITRPLADYLVSMVSPEEQEKIERIIKSYDS